MNDNAAQAEDIESKLKTIKDFELGPQDRDFAFLLKRIGNSLNGNGQLTLAVVPTAYFFKGVCHFFLVADRHKHNAKLRFVTDPAKITGFALEKLFCEKLPEEYFRLPSHDSSKLKEGRVKLSRIPMLKSSDSGKASLTNIENRSVLTGRRYLQLSSQQSLELRRIGEASEYVDHLKYNLLLRKTDGELP